MVLEENFETDELVVRQVSEVSLLEQNRRKILRLSSF